MIPISNLVPPSAGNPAETAMYQRVQNEFPKLVQEYSSLKEADGGKVLNTDIARELSPEYRADRTRSADIHEPASKFVKELYAKKLSEETPQGHDKRVVFTAGGTGAGKSTALEKLADTSAMVKRAEMVYDTNMNRMDSADKKIQQALASNRKASLMYTYRDPVEALTGGALPRAMRMEREQGTGRTVPLSEHLKTHIGSRDTIEQLAEKYKDHPDVAIHVIDNSRGRGNATVSSLDKLPKHNEKETKERLSDALQREFAAGRISKAVYLGTKHG